MWVMPLDPRYINSLCAGCHAEEEDRKGNFPEKETTLNMCEFYIDWEVIQIKLNIYLEASILSPKRSSYFYL